MKPPRVRVCVGDATQVLRGLADNSVQCVVTSPPYLGLRDYGVEGQIGGEESPHLFVGRLMEVFDEVKRVLRPDGVAFVNLGDSYVGSGRGIWNAPPERRQHVKERYLPTPGAPMKSGLPAKSLMGVPWRFAFAMQDRGWILRQDIIWAKPNPIPESVRDRFTKSHEYIFMFVKRKNYYWDAEGSKEPASSSISRLSQKTLTDQKGSSRVPGKTNGSMKAVGCSGGMRNRRSVWNVTTRPSQGEHFASYPPDLVRPGIAAAVPAGGCCSMCGAPYIRMVEKGNPSREHQRACGGSADGGYGGKSRKDYTAAKAQDASATKARILAGMREHITIGWNPSCNCIGQEAIPSMVLDPFGGTGTTALVAAQHGASSILIELNPQYAAGAVARLRSSKFRAMLEEGETG